MICPFVIPSAAAIFIGMSARRKIKASGGALGGEGLALAGIIIGAAGIVISLFSIGIVLLAFMAEA